MHTLTSVCARMLKLYTAWSMRMHIQGMCAHAKVLETRKERFYAFKTWFGTNPTSSGSRPKLLFSTIKSLKWSIFKGGGILKENTRDSLENGESKREFCPSSQYFYGWDIFWSWFSSFKCLLTNFGFVVTRLTEGNG